MEIGCDVALSFFICCQQTILIIKGMHNVINLMRHNISKTINTKKNNYKTSKLLVFETSVSNLSKLRAASAVDDFKKFHLVREIRSKTAPENPGVVPKRRSRVVLYRFIVAS